MIIDNPEFLWLLMGLGIFIPLFIHEYYQTRRALISLGGRWEDETLQGLVFIKTGLSSFFFCMFYVFAVIGLCGVSWGEHPVEEDRKGLDVVFAMDTSLSMLARDMGNSSRLERSREFVRSTAEDLPASRFALVAFRGAGVLLLPLTEDMHALNNALPYAGPSALTNPGTSLALGLQNALDAFSKGGNRHRVVVLLTDGENLQGSWSAMAQEMRQKGILLVAVGMGSPGGATIPISPGKLLTDTSGNPVKTRKDAAHLQSLTDTAGGVYLDGTSPGIYSRIVQEITSFQVRHEQEGFRLDPIRRDSVFIILALVSLTFFGVMKSVRWRNVW